MDTIAQIGIAYEVLRWEEKALVEVAKELNLKPKLLHLHSLYIPLDVEGRLNIDIDLVIQRAISHSVAINSTIAFESMGVHVINNSIATAIAMNKLWTLKVFAENDIPFPRTIITFDFEPSFEAAKVLGYPIVIKPIDGSWGRLLALARDEEELRALIEHRNHIPNPTIKINMMQEYVRKPNRDIRVFTVGNEVVTAIYRVNKHWITNTARGGIALPAKVDQELEELVLKVSRAVGGEVLGIDVFEDPERGYLVNEVNAIPEFKNTVVVTGVPLHRKIMEYVKNQIKR